MMLRAFVQFGSVGSYEERCEFEQAVLERWADLAVTHQIPAQESDVLPATWELAFRYWQLRQVQR